MNFRLITLSVAFFAVLSYVSASWRGVQIRRRKNYDRGYVRKVNGGWSSWGKWSKCNVKCGTGEIWRKRTCTNPKPANGGRKCSGRNLQRRKCDTRKKCPVNGGWSSWSEWSKCSAKCGTGKTWRKRACTNPKPANGGRKCSGRKLQLRKCDTRRKCPVNGGWSSWSEWSRCNVECGTGKTWRKRTCTSPKPANGGRNCSGKQSQDRKCDTGKECPVNGGWSSWGEWSKCNVKCGTGKTWRKRTCTNPKPANGGRKCSGKQSQDRKCDAGKECPVNGGWSLWGEWSKCNVKCGTGKTWRMRTCTNPKPANGGRNCSGKQSQDRKCDTGKECPVNGGWSSWGEWSKCNVKCGTGKTWRKRTCTNPKPANGGRNCSGKQSQDRKCDTGKECPVNGSWSSWGEWSKCNVECGKGKTWRKRTCTNPKPSNGGRKCSGEESQDRKCDTGKECPVNGGWTAWGGWSECEGECGTGISKRRRTCTNPAPAYGGSRCVGDCEEDTECDTGKPCADGYADDTTYW